MLTHTIEPISPTPEARLRPPRHLAADGRPLVEDAAAGSHLLELGSGPTAATSPSPGVEVNVAGGRVWVVHWLLGQRWRAVAIQGRG